MGASSIRPIRLLLWLVLPLLALFAALGPGGAVADTPATGNNIYLPFAVRPPDPQLEFVPFATGLGNKTITDIANAGDERLFVTGRAGEVWIVFPNGAVAPELFFDATNLVQLGADGPENDFEQGFLGLAFHPDYPATPYFYFAYTTPRTVAVARARVSATNPNKVEHGSTSILLSIRKPEKDAEGNLSAVHNAGDLAFGPDGYLYIPIGDGGPDPYDPWGVPGDPNNHSQRRDTLFGSILRIDVNARNGQPQDCGLNNLYTIPPGNPWTGDDGCDEIWAKGLRNPWRIAIDPLNGDMYIADVGEWLREEISFHPGGAAGGANYGWHCWEGNVNYAALFPQFAKNCPAGTTYTPPIYEYSHSQGECSIIGGLVYRGAKYPRLYGRYFFGDWCSGRLWTMQRESGQWKVYPAGDTVLAYSTFGEDMHGELYAGAYMVGTLFKVNVKYGQ